MGVAQMEGLDGYVERKRATALLYKKSFSEVNEAELVWRKRGRRAIFGFVR